MSGPLIQFRPYQREAFMCALRRALYLWRRQNGKSYLLASMALDRMMSNPGRLVTFISASIALGSEVILKEASIWAGLLEKLRAAAAGAHLKFESNADGLDLDAVCDLFEHSNLETKIWHSNTVCSRSRVIAPNPSTAVGWTGDIFADEVGRMPNLKEVLEAIMPFMDSNPDFILRMATTPPPDDQHYSFELFVPPAGAEFSVKPAGTWYRSGSGIMVHRVDAWDSAAAGVPLYHPDNGAPITPEEHRALAFDKSAWDRNYALKFLQGGTAAIPLAALARAMELGRGQCLALNVTEALAA